MSDFKFKTMRHIETVRNYINYIIAQLLLRGQNHDQSKLENPELEVFVKYTPKLKKNPFGSKAYLANLKKMGIAIQHHVSVNRHHPEYFKNGMADMNLVDLLELICDWKSATLRIPDGDIFKSLDKNQKRFKYSDELKQILKNTVILLDSGGVAHKANES